MAVESSSDKTIEAEPDVGVCVTCGGPPQEGCGTCARRRLERRRDGALQLVEAGMPLRRVARETGVDRNTLRRARRSASTSEQVDNRQLRHAVDRAMQIDSALSLSEIARRAGYCGGATHVARLLGRIPTARCRRGARVYPPRLRREIPIDDAVRIARAAGLDPVDVDL